MSTVSSTAYTPASKRPTRPFGDIDVLSITIPDRFINQSSIESRSVLRSSVCFVVVVEDSGIIFGVVVNSLNQASVVQSKQEPFRNVYRIGAIISCGVVNQLHVITKGGKAGLVWDRLVSSLLINTRSSSSLLREGARCEGRNQPLILGALCETRGDGDRRTRAITGRSSILITSEVMGESV